MMGMFPVATRYLVTSVGDPRPQAVKQQERIATIREVVIKDLSGQELNVTLWDNRATEFLLPEASTSHGLHSVVVLFLGCLPKLIANTTYINGGDMCTWVFNPHIREAQPLYDRLKVSPVLVYRPPPQLPGAAHTVNPVVYEHKTLQELNKIDPYDFPKDGYKCTVTITAVSHQKKWFYIGCAKFKKATDVETVPFQCPVATCLYRECATLYKLHFTATDDTSEAKFFAYDDASRRLIQCNIRVVLRQAQKHGEVPQALKNMVSKKFTLVFRPTDDSFYDMDDRTYLVRAVLVDFQEEAFKAKQLQLMGTEAGAPTTPQNQHLLEYSQHTTNSDKNALTVSDIMPTITTSTPPPALDADNTPNKPPGTRSPERTSLAPKELFPPETSTDKDASTETIGDAADISSSSKSAVHNASLPHDPPDSQLALTPDAMPPMNTTAQDQPTSTALLPPTRPADHEVPLQRKGKRKMLFFQWIACLVRLGSSPNPSSTWYPLCCLLKIDLDVLYIQLPDLRLCKLLCTLDA